MIDPISTGISILALIAAATMRHGQNQALNELEKAKLEEAKSKESEDEMRQALVDLIDLDGNMKMQIAIPGEVYSDESLKTIVEETKNRESALEERLKKQIEKKRDDSNVLFQIRLPGFVNKKLCIYRSAYISKIWKYKSITSLY